MNDEGWVKLHRAILSHPLWTCLSPTVYKVASYLILSAAFKPEKHYDGYHQIEVQRGTLIISQRELASKCRISYQQARDSLGHLERLKVITLSGTHMHTVVTICNYDRYQSTQENENAGETPLGNALTTHFPRRRNAGGTQEERTSYKEEECKKVRMEEVEQTPARSATAWKSEAFARFWEVCWYRRSKDAAWRAFCKVAVTIEIAEDIIRGVKHHGPRLMLEAKQSRRTPIYPATWLHAGGWKDEPEPMLDLVPTNGKPADNLTFRQKDRADEKGMFHHMLAREAQKNG